MDFDIDRLVDEVNALLDSSLPMDRATRIIKEETQSITGIINKALAQTITWHFVVCILRRWKHFASNNSSSLDDTQKSKLLGILREHRKALWWTIADIKGINPIDCMHYIHLDENAKPSRKMKHQLNPNMKEVIRVEVLKLLDAGIIYHISNSS